MKPINKKSINLRCIICGSKKIYAGFDEKNCYCKKDYLEYLKSVHF